MGYMNPLNFIHAW